MKDFINDLKHSFKGLLMYEYKYLMVLFLIAILCYVPMDYYIIIGGGIDDISSRIEVKDGYESKGSLNLSYVTTTDGVLLTYLLSYVVPNWSRNSVDTYKYNNNDSENDINYRSDMLLQKANSDATYIAYTKAGKDIELTSTKYNVISVMDGCHLKVKDEVLEIDGNKIDGFDYNEYISSLKVGQKVKIKVLRNNKEKMIETPVRDLNGRLLLGVYLQKVELYHTDPKITFKFKRTESGPSGGLLTTLSIYNQLVNEDITKGLAIAGTGTIDEEGNVGEVGGVDYKLRGAIAGNADVFIVPSGDNYKDVMKIVKDEDLKIKVIEATTFDEVLNKLEELK
ncbi:MAG: S16 family serine protease [Bacilli bacterium]|nr:S16 family serine protease [Bacilli bacterium]